MTITVKWEVTDTYGGESNYSWVKRGVIECNDGASDLAIVRRVKNAIGWNGERCKKDNYGDMITLWPVGVCQVCFITFD